MGDNENFGRHHINCEFFSCHLSRESVEKQLPNNLLLDQRRKEEERVCVPDAAKERESIFPLTSNVRVQCNEARNAIKGKGELTI